ncbi:hypothetical protein SeMB42_g07665 [Synchytrium endobioticum]|uniref:Helicase ATP-binding domain-containing protein n=1 Tax=Synchytrium endobioticum TaxID=286115 RepID=A0A507C393_9FUNG|nr:hypothetical protein SeMB42_g07665 [Synchytrium endobioticum]
MASKRRIEDDHAQDSEEAQLRSRAKKRARINIAAAAAAAPSETRPRPRVSYGVRSKVIDLTIDDYDDGSQSQTSDDLDDNYVDDRASQEDADTSGCESDPASILSASDAESPASAKVSTSAASKPPHRKAPPNRKSPRRTTKNNADPVVSSSPDDDIEDDLDKDTSTCIGSDPFTSAQRKRKSKSKPKSPKDGDLLLDQVTALFAQNNGDYTHLLMKQDHDLRPLYITNDNLIILEAFSPIADQAQDFLAAIAEPVSRPSHVHEYRLTEYSLYAAVSVGLETNNIIDVLNRLSKLQVPKPVEQFIKKYTLSYGKIKLLLQHNRYYVESRFPAVLEKLLRDDLIKEAVLDATLVDTVGRSDAIVFPTSPTVSKKPPTSTATGTVTGISTSLSVLPTASSDVNAAASEWADQQPQQVGWMADVMNEDADTENTKSFEIDPAKAEQVRKRCSDLTYPMLEEYDFRNDDRNPNTMIDLKPSTLVRPYQAKALSKMFGNGRARSGIIVLPCGAGKTLTGVAAACTIKKSVLVLCWSAVSVAQWIREFHHWSTALDADLGRFDSEVKKPFTTKAGILVSTYSMVAYTGNRAYDAQKMMKMIDSQEWGLLILDEVTRRAC